MKKNIFKSITLLLAVTSLTSCLKDDTLVLDPAKGHNVIEFANPAQIAVNGTPSPLYVFSYDAASTPTLPITISYSGPEAVAPQDITVKFTVGSQAKIDEYNSATSNHYVMLKPVSYTLSTNEVVIKAGTSKATFNIALKPSTFDFAVSEVLPLTITSASSGIISGNFSTILLNLGAKNKFDGVYTYYALHEAPDRPTFLIGTEFKYPNDVQLRTTGASKDNLFNTYYGDFLIPLLTSTNGTSGFGSTNLVLEFDPATNKVISAANANIAPANGRAMNLDLTANNYFDPATHNVFVTYFMTQPGFSPLKITARLVYKGSR